MDLNSLNAVNPHYLQNVMKLTKKKEVVAREDVYNARGLKLIAKGAPVDNSLYDRLVQFKLHRPLESSLTVDQGITSDGILEEASALLDTVRPLSGLLEATNCTSKVLSVLKEIHLDEVATLLLTMEQNSETGAFRHSVLVSLFCLAFGMKLGLDGSMLPKLAVAGLLHDVGELYINQEYLQPGRKLGPDEWKHIVVHPHIGQLVIDKMTEYPRMVAIAIAEHHERANGFGYPRQITNELLSPLGKILLVCEALCGILAKEDRGIERALLAAKVVPGEYPPEMVYMIATLPREPAPNAQNISRGPMNENLIARTKRIEQAINTAAAMLESSTGEDNAASPSSTFAKQVLDRLLMLRRAMFDTGLSPSKNLEEMAHDVPSDIQLEMEAVLQEIGWRLNELSRQITLIDMQIDERLRSHFENIVACLVLK